MRSTAGWFNEKSAPRSPGMESVGQGIGAAASDSSVSFRRRRKTPASVKVRQKIYDHGSWQGRSLVNEPRCRFVANPKLKTII